MQDWNHEVSTAVSLVIIDPEDVLYDGRPMRIQALARALNDHLSSQSGSSDENVPDLTQLTGQIERSVDAPMAILLREDGLRHILDRVEEIRSELMQSGTITPFPHSLEVLRRLKDYGCEIACYSSGWRDTLLTLMERLQLDPLIGFCSCTQDAGRMIPAGAIPDILENLQFLPGETVIVSNNPVILSQAHEMQIPAVVCRWSNPTPEALSHAARTIDTPDQLYRIVVPDDASSTL